MKWLQFSKCYLLLLCYKYYKFQGNAVKPSQLMTVAFLDKTVRLIRPSHRSGTA